MMRRRLGGFLSLRCRPQYWVILICLCLALWSQYWGPWFLDSAAGESMMPAYPGWHLVILSRWREPQIGDAVGVIWACGQGHTHRWFKRVIAKGPGYGIYGFDIVVRDGRALQHWDIIALAEGEYMVRGDSRCSIAIGPIGRHQIQGVAIWPKRSGYPAMAGFLGPEIPRPALLANGRRWTAWNESATPEKSGLPEGHPCYE